MDINLQQKIEPRKIQYEGLEYLINNADLTAGVIGYNSTKINVIIPRSIIFESKEFIVISILEHAFDRKVIKSIEFAADSEVRTIENNAFEYCYVESISFPPSLIELKAHWSFCM